MILKTHLKNELKTGYKCLIYVSCICLAVGHNWTVLYEDYKLGHDFVLLYSFINYYYCYSYDLLELFFIYFSC